MRAYALRMAAGEDDVRWPDFVLFLGDQVYADETSSEMEEFIKSRRDITEPPRDEPKDYEEYTPPLQSSPGATRPTGGCSRRCRA